MISKAFALRVTVAPSSSDIEFKVVVKYPLSTASVSSAVRLAYSKSVLVNVVPDRRTSVSMKQWLEKMLVLGGILMDLM